MKVSLFVTCLVDQLFPNVGKSTVQVLRRCGVDVTFNPRQTCCGQPAFNSGYRDEARGVASHWLDVFSSELESADYVVVPSGSGAAMTCKFYAPLFADDSPERERAARVGTRVVELSEFLVDIMGVTDVGASFDGVVTYHESCHLKRELGISRQPRALIAAVRGARMVEMERADACCGFGGTFSVKFPEISSAIDEEKIASIERCGADAVIGCDASCLMQMAGLLRRRGSSVRCLHLSELLAAGSP